MTGNSFASFKSARAAVLVLGMAFFFADVAGAESQRVQDLATLQREVVGKPLENNNGSVRITIEPNGQLTGFRNNQKLTGNWQFRDGYFCRSFVVDRFIGQEDCQVLSYDDDGITITRAQGRGDRIKYYFTE